MLRTAVALFDIGSRRQCSTKLSAAESNGPSTGSGFITSASTVVGAYGASRREACCRTVGFGSRRVIRVPAGGAASAMKYPVPGPTSRCRGPRCRRYCSTPEGTEVFQTARVMNFRTHTS